jgi:uncharacterized protein YlxW (UPF0749 family)
VLDRARLYVSAAMLADTIAIAALAAATVYLARKVSNMSTPTFEQLTQHVRELKKEKLELVTENAQLKAAESDKDSQIATLTAQLSAAQAAAGTTDADLAALDAEVETALDPVPGA